MDAGKEFRSIDNWIRSLVKSRKILYQSNDPKLNPIGLEYLKNWFIEQNFNSSDSDLFAVSLSLRHKYNVYNWGTGSRNSEKRKQITKLCNAIPKFKEALIGLSLDTKQSINSILYETECFDRNNDKISAVAVSRSARSYASTFIFHKDLHRVLDFIFDGCSELLESIPKDRGGKASGGSDLDGAKAKRELTNELKWYFQHLDLPLSTTAGGPFSTCWRLIHFSATGENNPDLADDYAGRINSPKYISPWFD